MSTDRDTTRFVRSWLEEGVTALPDRVLDAVLDQLPATPQRRPWWPARRIAQVNRLLPALLAAAAVLIVAVVGYNLLAPSNTAGPPGPSASVTPTPAPPATATPAATVPGASGPWVLWQGPLPAGTYVANPFPAPNDALQILFTVPDGWHGAPPGAVTPAVGPGGPDGAAVAAQRPMALYVDPCLGQAEGSPTLPAGETVDDLVDALVEISSGPEPPYTVTTPESTVLSGYAGKRLDLLLPSDVDFSTCNDGTFWVWDVGPYAQGPGNRWHLWILDVDGTRVVIFAQDFATTSPETRADLEAIVDSIRIQP
jgi:hypothetical protein